MQAATELPQYSTINKTEKQNNKTNRKPETNKNKQQDNPLGDGLPFKSFTVLFWVLLLQPGGTFINSLKKRPGPAASQGTWLPTRTGQAGASWEPESCHSWGAGKKTWGVRQPQTGWDKQAT